MNGYINIESKDVDIGTIKNLTLDTHFVGTKLSCFTFHFRCAACVPTMCSTPCTTRVHRVQDFILNTTVHVLKYRSRVTRKLTIKSILLLQTIDKLNISLLRFLRLDALIMNLLPGAALRFLLQRKHQH